MNIKIGDVVKFLNEETIEINKNNIWIIQKYYNDDLTCKTEKEYDIIKVYRPMVKVIYERELDYDRTRETTKGK